MVEKILERLEVSKHVNFNYHIRTDYRTIVEQIFDEVISIVQEVAKDGGWIPCSERLPKEFDTVLVTMADNCLGFSHELGSIDIGYLNNRVGFCGACGTYSIDNIIAWQPLPEPYQKGE